MAAFDKWAKLICLRKKKQFLILVLIYNVTGKFRNRLGMPLQTSTKAINCKATGLTIEYRMQLDTPVNLDYLLLRSAKVDNLKDVFDVGSKARCNHSIPLRY